MNQPVTRPRTHRPTWAATIGFLSLVAGVLSLSAYFDWPRTRAWVVAIAVFLLMDVALTRAFPALRRDGSPTPRLYLLAAAAGALAGLAFGLAYGGHFSMYTTSVWALGAPIWVWIGALIRAPFGAKPWPSYRD